MGSGSGWGWGVERGRSGDRAGQVGNAASQPKGGMKHKIHTWSAIARAVRQLSPVSSTHCMPIWCSAATTPLQGARRDRSMSGEGA